MASTLHAATRSARSARLYRSLQDTLAPVLAEDPADHPTIVRQAIALRMQLLAELGLPATRHNVDRLVVCAAAGASLALFMRDVDRRLASAVLADEALFLAVLALHAAARGILTAHDRCYDAEAFLSLPHDGRSSPAVAAFLAGALSWADLMSACGRGVAPEAA
ncbi:MAG: hypothetical protein IT385_23150 [Deltaproteobacteria bacterium]|nr:hypothetical protein [Deltaproteobacteria bacterium]